ncbi:MAG: hypothetical protein EBU84_19505 [Actinobacteria bacterium]|jgi:hypothetical protein|nr:hypothetical protein [Actinomycetota bacterium]
MNQSQSQTEKDIAYLKQLLATPNISRREEIEIRHELTALEEKQKTEGIRSRLIRLGVSLYGSYFSSDVKLE